MVKSQLLIQFSNTGNTETVCTKFFESHSALHGYFESLRTEKMGTGISVCMLCPGPTFSRCRVWLTHSSDYDPTQCLLVFWFTLLSSLLEVAATETPGQSFGESMKATDKRMTAERWQLHIFFCSKWLSKVCRALPGGNCEQAPRVVDLLPPRPSPHVRQPVSARDFKVCILFSQLFLSFFTPFFRYFQIRPCKSSPPVFFPIQNQPCVLLLEWWWQSWGLPSWPEFATAETRWSLKS